MSAATLLIWLATGALACPGPVSLGTGLSILTHNDLYGKSHLDPADRRRHIFPPTIPPHRFHTLISSERSKYLLSAR